MKMYDKQTLKGFFHARLEAVYHGAGMTQAEMALLLSMGLRPFAPPAKGESCRCALAFARFLLDFRPGRRIFLDEPREALEKPFCGSNPSGP